MIIIILNCFNIGIITAIAGAIVIIIIVIIIFGLYRYVCLSDVQSVDICASTIPSRNSTDFGKIR